MYFKKAFAFSIITTNLYERKINLNNTFKQKKYKYGQRKIYVSAKSIQTLIIYTKEDVLERQVKPS